MSLPQTITIAGVEQANSLRVASRSIQSDVPGRQVAAVSRETASPGITLPETVLAAPRAALLGNRAA